MSKGLKMLKYITRDKELRRIPVIMMSAQDEVSIVVKCLKFGAADYLVKPLRTNELLNLWTHMWRRRRMLGLEEKNIVNYDFDMVVSDPSDANTNSTTLFSDDTDDKSRKSINPVTCVLTHEEDETNAAATPSPIETPTGALSERQPDVPVISDRQTGKISPFPKKSGLKIGESSAFFTYIKSSTPQCNNQGDASVRETLPRNLRIKEKLTTMKGRVGADFLGHDNRDSLENHFQEDEYPSSNSIPDSFSVERSCTPPISLETSQQRNSNEEFSQVHMHPRNESPHYGVGFLANPAQPYYMSGVMNQSMMSSAAVYRKHTQPQDLHYHANSSLLPQYNHIPQGGRHVPGMTSYPYYPFGICLQHGEMPTTTHAWPSQRNSSSNEGELSNVDRREAALMKFKQKRKERCFDKKIRYANRKQLAERRPRVKGQFVWKVNGVNVDLNGLPASAEDEVGEEEDQRANTDYLPEDNSSICH
ncbi:two-component response regulator-like APRR1 [Olea europaea subsp. europaea]|nr:two-component response regulator-like APRR1 [Olea europaea subsp. europaea]